MIVITVLLITIIALLEFILLMFLEILEAVLSLPKKIRRKIHEKGNHIRNRRSHPDHSDPYDDEHEFFERIRRNNPESRSEDRRV